MTRRNNGDLIGVSLLLVAEGLALWLHSSPLFAWGLLAVGGILTGVLHQVWERRDG